MISYIILAAGSSSRFHSPKALAQIDHQPAINHLLQTIISCKINEIIVVLGDRPELIQPMIFKHNSIRIVHNKDHILGQTSSVITALKSTDYRSDAFAINPVDCPFILQQTILDLIHCFYSKRPDILIPCHNSKKGHPPIFNAKVKNHILGLDPTVGINRAFNDPSYRVELTETSDAGVCQSFNTVKEFNDLLDRRKKII